MTHSEKRALGLFKKKTTSAVILTKDGVVKFRRPNGKIVYGTKGQFKEVMAFIMDEYSTFSDLWTNSPRGTYVRQVPNI
ncbi:hypothetical protein MGH68_04420 [Erysipelothrix sp. D19-032]